MRVSNWYLFLVLIFLWSPGAYAGTFPEGADGPYLFHLPGGGIRILSVTPEGEVKNTTFRSVPSGFSMPVVTHTGDTVFSVSLHPFSRPAWQYREPDQLFVLSDPHGNWECFSELLKTNGVVNDRYEWNYGTNHLMIIGDVFDRGDDVLPILWLIYKLEQEAEEAGGNVSFLLGNHEAMVLAGNLGYINHKYAVLAWEKGFDYPELFGPDTELGRWLSTRNTIQMIGDNLFVHAGLSAGMLDISLSVPEINELISSALYIPYKERKSREDEIGFLHGSNGPLWYRGMVNEKLTPDTLDLIMQKYQTSRIITGHTIFRDISFLYDGKVVDVNVNNERNRNEGLGRAIVIEKDLLHVVY